MANMDIDRGEVARYMRMKLSELDGELADRVDRLLDLSPINPKGVWMRNGDRFFFCGTIGGEFDRWQRSLAVSSAADAFIAQAIGSAAVEKVMDDLESEFSRTLHVGESIGRRYSPGYAAIPLSRNRDIASLLDTAKRIGVTVSDSMALVPSKSVIAICDVKKDSVCVS